MKINLILLLVGLLTAAGSYGQSESSLKDSLESPLIITHSRQATTLKSAYKPTIIISKEAIQSSITDDLSLLLDQQVGMSVIGSYSNPAKDKSIFLQGASGEFTLILLDGVPLTDPSGIGGTFDPRSINLSQLERIEIVKGGQSALYGSDAIAGVINLITTSKAELKPTGSISTAYGSLNTRKLQGQLSVPFSSKLGFKMDAGYSGSDGISEALEVQGDSFDKDGFDRTGGSASIIWSPSSSWTIRPFVRYSTFDGDYDGGAFSDSEETYETDWLQGGVSVNGEIGSTQFNGSYSTNKTDRVFNSNFGLFGFNGRFQNLDIYGNSALFDVASITYGVNHQSHKMLDETAAILNPKTTLISPYASLRYTPEERSNIELGLRFNNHTTFGSNLNYSIGASRWLSDQVKAYGYWATSFKAPNLFQLYGQFGANADLNPQIGRSLNLGLSFSDIGIIKKIDVAYFNRVVDSLIVYDFATGYSNVARQNDSGIELSGSTSFSQFDISMSYAYLIGKSDQRDGSEPKENLLRRPKHQVDMSLAYRYSDRDAIRLTIKQAGSRPDAFFDNNTFETQEVTLDSYLLANLFADYSISEQIKIHGEVRNLLNTEFQEIAGFSTIGRNIHIGVSVDF